MSKVVKRMVIDEIRNRLDGRRDMLLLDTSRMDAISDNQLRLALEKKGITLLGIKNTLARVAFREVGFAVSEEVLSGPSTLVFGGEDVVGLSREMSEWAKKIDKLSIKGGVIDGQGVDAQSVDEISKGPSRQELIGQIVGLILSPGARLAAAVLGPGGKLAGQLKTLSEKETSGEQISGGAA